MRRKQIPQKYTQDSPELPLAQPPEHWAGFLLFRVAAIAKDLYETRLSTLRLRPSHVGILQMLATEGPTIQAQLAERLGVDKAAMVSCLNDLENGRLVERRNHPEDRRAFLVYARPEGLKMLSEIQSVNEQSSEDLLKGLNAEEQHTFSLLLTRIYDSHS